MDVKTSTQPAYLKFDPADVEVLLRRLYDGEPDPIPDSPPRPRPHSPEPDPRPDSPPPGFPDPDDEVGGRRACREGSGDGDGDGGKMRVTAAAAAATAVVSVVSG